MKRIEGNIVDIYQRKIFPGTVVIDQNRIVSIIENSNIYDHYILPGFIDAHVHLESSMLLPVEFSRLAISKGTVAIVTDPHEIANVLGIPGIDFMIENSKDAFIKIYFTIPSCVPATSFDYGGSKLSAQDTEVLLKTGYFVGLSEMMNIPGVLSEDVEVWKKLYLCREAHLVIDGHAPGLKGSDLKKYIEAGISTDHECSGINEAIEKIISGMKILIREGSAAKNYESLKFLIKDYPDKLMFCTDDCHPDDLIFKGHIDKMVRKAVQEGFDLFDVLKIAILNPIKHYGLSVGTLKIGDPADFIICRDLRDFQTLSVYIEGVEQYRIGGNLLSFSPDKNDIGKIIAYSKQKFIRKKVNITELSKSVQQQITAIKVLKNEILTEKVIFPVKFSLKFESDISRDILKIVYLNRYTENSIPQVAYITGIGLKKGAFATSISHDSHNIIAVGCSDQDLAEAINSIISNKGGLSVVCGGKVDILSLPIAGIMTICSAEEVAEGWKQLMETLVSMGCSLESPFMTLSFMALIVIPELKIGEKGLFEFSKFGYIHE